MTVGASGASSRVLGRGYDDRVGILQHGVRSCRTPIVKSAFVATGRPPTEHVTTSYSARPSAVERGAEHPRRDAQLEREHAGKREHDDAVDRRHGLIFAHVGFQVTRQRRVARRTMPP